MKHYFTGDIFRCRMRFLIVPICISLIKVAYMQLNSWNQKKRSNIVVNRPILFLYYLFPIFLLFIILHENSLIPNRCVNKFYQVSTQKRANSSKKNKINSRFTIIYDYNNKFELEYIGMQTQLSEKSSGFL